MSQTLTAKVIGVDGPGGEYNAMASFTINLSVIAIDAAVATPSNAPSGESDDGDDGGAFGE